MLIVDDRAWKVRAHGLLGRELSRAIRRSPITEFDGREYTRAPVSAGEAMIFSEAFSVPVQFRREHGPAQGPPKYHRPHLRCARQRRQRLRPAEIASFLQLKLQEALAHFGILGICEQTS